MKRTAQAVWSGALKDGKGAKAGKHGSDHGSGSGLGS